MERSRLSSETSGNRVSSLVFLDSAERRKWAAMHSEWIELRDRSTHAGKHHQDSKHHAVSPSCGIEVTGKETWPFRQRDKKGTRQIGARRNIALQEQGSETKIRTTSRGRKSHEAPRPTWRAGSHPDRGRRGLGKPRHP